MSKLTLHCPFDTSLLIMHKPAQYGHLAPILCVLYCTRGVCPAQKAPCCIQPLSFNSSEFTFFCLSICSLRYIYLKSDLCMETVALLQIIEPRVSGNFRSPSWAYLQPPRLINLMPEQKRCLLFSTHFPCSIRSTLKSPVHFIVSAWVREHVRKTEDLL